MRRMGLEGEGERERETMGMGMSRKLSRSGAACKMLYTLQVGR